MTAEQQNENWRKVGVKGMKGTSFIMVLSLLIGVFVPSEQQMYIIYGVGGVIDYAKSNDKVKKLPDKVLDALDAWVDTKETTDKR